MKIQPRSNTEKWPKIRKLSKLSRKHVRRDRLQILLLVLSEFKRVK